MLNPLLHKVRLVALIFCSFFLVSCVTTSDVGPDPQLEEIQVNLIALRDNLNEQYSTICEAQQAELKSDYESVQKDYDAEKTNNDVVKNKLRASQNKYVKLEQRCETKNAIGKLLVGEIENVRLLKEALTFSARIDTGAETSSLGVYQLQDFERDGKTWVKFKLADDESAKTYEYRVNNRVIIKQSANTEGDERFEIKVNIGIGNKDYPRQIFNLSDRSYLEHQILIGRSFLTDTAIVDTSSKHMLKNN